MFVRIQGKLLKDLQYAPLGVSTEKLQYARSASPGSVQEIAFSNYAGCLGSLGTRCSVPWQAQMEPDPMRRRTLLAGSIAAGSQAADVWWLRALEREADLDLPAP